MRRGEVWWANLPPPDGPRPVVLLSRDVSIQVRAYVTVAPVTTRMRGLPTEVALGLEEGLSRSSVVNLDVLNTVPKVLLRRYLGALTPTKLQEAEVAIHFALGLET